MMILVNFEKNWADEFDVYGFKIYASQKDLDVDLATLPELEFSFGTNEGWEEGEITEEDFTVTEISTVEADLLEKLLGNEFGVFPL
jgi:hypothetical protein